ncbi:MAG: hypothetical protein ACUVXG_05125 [Anaerolineae bacterium]
MGRYRLALWQYLAEVRDGLGRLWQGHPGWGAYRLTNALRAEAFV